MRRVTKTETLDALLRQMMQQQQQQQRIVNAPRVTAFKPVASAPAVSRDGGSMKPIRIGNRDYSWAELSRPDVRRQLLPQVEALFPQIKRDPAAFGLTPADVPFVAAWTTGQYDGLSEAELYAALPAPAEAAEGDKNVASTLTPGANAPAIDGKTAFREIAAIAGSPEGRIALQRHANGQALDPAQKALIQRHDELLAANDAQARLERPPSDAPPPMRLYLGRDVLDFTKNPSKTERRHLAAEHIAKVKADNGHPYWDARSPEHKAAVLGMKVATEMMQTGDSFVQLNEDGSVQE
jgi:hypothetical protein